MRIGKIADDYLSVGPELPPTPEEKRILELMEHEDKIFVSKALWVAWVAINIIYAIAFIISAWPSLGVFTLVIAAILLPASICPFATCLLRNYPLPEEVTEPPAAV